MSSGERRNGLQGRYCFVYFFLHQMNVKILIGHDLMNCLIHPFDWSATCHSKPKRSSHIYIQQGRYIKRSFQTNSRGNAMIFGRKWYQIRAKSKAKEGDWTVLRKTDLLAVLPTGYGKSLIYQLLVLLAKRAGNYASYVSNNASFQRPLATRLWKSRPWIWLPDIWFRS